MITVFIFVGDVVLKDLLIKESALVSVTCLNICLLLQSYFNVLTYGM